MPANGHLIDAKSQNGTQILQSGMKSGRDDEWLPLAVSVALCFLTIAITVFS
jgi:hypothetical protein